MRWRTPSAGLLVLAGAALLLFLGAVVWALAAQRDAGATRRLVEDAHAVIGRLDGLLTDLADAEASQRGFLLTGEEAYLEPYAAALPRIERNLAAVTAPLAVEPGRAERLGELSRLVEARLGSLRRAVEAYRETGVEAALAIVRTHQGKALMDAIRGALVGLEAEERELLRERIGRLERQAATATVALALAGLLSLALGASTGALLLRAARAGRRRAEQALSEEEAHARAIIDLNPQVLWTARPDGGIEDFAERWLAWTGLTREQALGDGWTRVAHPDDLPRMAGAWSRSVATGAPYDVEHRIRMADGSFRWMRSRAVARRDPATGEVVRWYGTTEDVHERRLAEDALRGSEARLRSVVETAPDGILVADLEGGHIVSANQAALRIFGYEGLEELAGRDLGALMPSAEAARHDGYLAAHRATGVPGRELLGRRRDGTEFPVDLSVGFFEAEGGRFFTGVVRDVTARRAAEAALAEGEARFRAMADNIPQLAWMARRDGWIFWYNRRWFDYTGATLEDMEGWGWRKVHHPDHVARVVERIQRAWDTGEPWEDTFPLRGKDGAWRWFLSRAEPIRDAEGEVALWFGTNTDVTEQRAAEAALRESEARFRAAVDLAPFPVLLHAEDGEILQANEAWQELSGWRWPEDIPTIADWTEHAYGERREQLGAYIDTLYALDRRVDEGDYGIRTKSGETRVWSFGSAPVGRDPKGRRLVVSMAADVTELRRGGEALRRSLAEQRAVYASAPVGLSAHDRELRFRAVNGRLAAINGVPAEDHIGRTLREVVPGAAGLVEPLLRRVLETGEPVAELEIEAETAAHPGERRFYLASYYPVRAEQGGEVDGVSVAVLDIDARKRAEAALRELAATLERRVEERTLALSDTLAQLDAFAYTVSHDLRAPLRAMDGFARILLEEHAEALGERGRRFTTRIVDAARRMDELIQDLLAYSRLSRAEIELGWVDLEALVDAAVADAVAGAGAAAPPEVTVERPLPPVRGSRVVLAQIVTNLLANAVKFVAAGDRPRLRVRAGAHVGRNGPRVRLWVEDAGIGIAKEHQSRIFDVFERLHGQESYPGTGIGLAIVRKGAERMGGTAGVESEGPGQGSRFWVELPAADGTDLGGPT